MSDNSKLKENEDYYFDEHGRMVLTAKYLARRGHCCSNGCRHCPYKKKQSMETNEPGCC